MNISNKAKKPNRLVVEYCASYSKKFLNFYFYATSEMLDSFTFEVCGDKNYINLIDLYYSVLKKYSLPKFTNAELVLNVFDISSNQIILKEETNKLFNNFKVDTLGPNYKDNYFMTESSIHLEGRRHLFSYSIASIERPSEIRDLLGKLGITECKVYLINEYIEKYLNDLDVENSVLFIEDNDICNVYFYVEKQIISSCLVETNNKGAQLNSIKNYIFSYSDRVLAPNDVHIIDTYVAGNISNPFILDKDPKVLKDFNASNLYANSLPKKYVNLSNLKKSVSEAPKQPSKWKEFFTLSIGPKKGFTLVEAAVAISIFAIVGAMVVSFVLFYKKNTNDTKCNILAENYLKNVNTLFNKNPEKETIKQITTYGEEEPLASNHSYYINASMDIDSASLSKNDMMFEVSFTYNISEYTKVSKPEELCQDYSKYELSIYSIRPIDGNKSYCDQTNFVVVK